MDGVVSAPLFAAGLFAGMLLLLEVGRRLGFTLQLDPVNPLFDTVIVDSSASFSDFMLGARYTWAMAERWGLTLRGDGSFGDTEGTWNASAIGQYRMKRGAWYLGLSPSRCRDRDGKRLHQHHDERTAGRIRLHVLSLNHKENDNGRQETQHPDPLGR